MPRPKIMFDKEMEFFDYHLSNHLVLLVDGLLKYKDVLEPESFEKQYLELECRRVISELEWVDGYVVKVCPSEAHEKRHRLLHYLFFTADGRLDIDSKRFYARLVDKWNECRKQLLPHSLKFPDYILKHEAIDAKNVELACIRRLLQNLVDFSSRHNRIRFFEETGEIEFNGVKKPFVRRGCVQFVVLNTIFASENNRIEVRELNSVLDDYFDEIDDLASSDEIRDHRRSKTLYNARDKINSKFRTKFKDEMSEGFDLVVLANGFCSLSDMVRVKDR